MSKPERNDIFRSGEGTGVQLVHNPDVLMLIVGYLRIPGGLGDLSQNYIDWDGLDGCGDPAGSASRHEGVEEDMCVKPGEVDCPVVKNHKFPGALRVTVHILGA